MYSVVGADGQVYGPVDVHVLRQWIAEDRITPATNLIEAATGRTILAGNLLELTPTFDTLPPPDAPSFDQFQLPPTPVRNPYLYGPAMPFSPPKSKTTAILLAFFLGGLGIHRLYLGHTGTGLIMLLLPLLTCGFGFLVTGIWGFVDLILICTDALGDASGQPLA